MPKKRFSLVEDMLHTRDLQFESSLLNVSKIKNNVN